MRKKINWVVVFLFLLTSCQVSDLKKIKPKDLKKASVSLSYNFDIKNASELIERADGLIEVRIKKIVFPAYYLEPTDFFPVSEIKVENDAFDYDTLFWSGGIIESKDELDTSSFYGIDQRFIYYEFTDLTKLEENKSYYVAYVIVNDKAFILANLYGMFSLDESTQLLENLKTKETINLTNVNQ